MEKIAYIWWIDFDKSALNGLFIENHVEHLYPVYNLDEARAVLERLIRDGFGIVNLYGQFRGRDVIALADLADNRTSITCVFRARKHVCFVNEPLG